MTYTLGTLIGLPIAAILVIGLIVLAAFAVSGPNGDPGLSAGLLAAASAVLVVAGVAWWPWNLQYHRYQLVSGKVAAISSRFVGGDHSSNQKFVIRFADGRERGIDDTRAALVKPGDVVTLECKRAYKWGSTPGWDCNWATADGGAS